MEERILEDKIEELEIISSRKYYCKNLINRICEMFEVP